MATPPTTMPVQIVVTYGVGSAGEYAKNIAEADRRAPSHENAGLTKLKHEQDRG